MSGKLTGLYFLFMVLFISCSKDPVSSDLNQQTTISSSNTLAYAAVSASVTGFVVNEYEIPQPNTLVQIGTITSETDEYDSFQLQGIEMNGNGTYIYLGKY